MAVTRYKKIALTGGAVGALDSVDGANLLDNDEAHVYVNGSAYHYQLDASSGATENSPYVISPDANAGTKRWILFQSGGTYAANTDVDTGAETVDTFPDTAGDGAEWLYVIKKGTANLRTGHMLAAWDANLNTVAYAEDSTEDLGDTSDLALTVDINSNNVRFLATAASDNWSVKAFRRLL